MALATITIIGNLTRDPEVRFTQSGKSVASLAVATNDRRKDGDQWVDGDTTFHDVTVWDTLGENAAERLRKGDQVIILGRQRMREWEDAEGNKRGRMETTATEVGLSMRWLGERKSKAAPQQSQARQPEPVAEQMPF